MPISGSATSTCHGLLRDCTLVFGGKPWEDMGKTFWQNIWEDNGKIYKHMGFPHGKFIFAIWGFPHEIPMETSKFHFCFWGVLAIAIHGDFSYGISGVHWRNKRIQRRPAFVDFNDSTMGRTTPCAGQFAKSRHLLVVMVVPCLLLYPGLTAGFFWVLYSKLCRTPMESKFRFIVATKRWLNPGSWMFLAVLTVFQWPKSHIFFWSLVVLLDLVKSMKSPK